MIPNTIIPLEILNFSGNSDVADCWFKLTHWLRFSSHDDWVTTFILPVIQKLLHWSAFTDPSSNPVFTTTAVGRTTSRTRLLRSYIFPADLLTCVWIVRASGSIVAVSELTGVFRGVFRGLFQGNIPAFACGAVISTLSCHSARHKGV